MADSWSLRRVLGIFAAPQLGGGGWRLGEQAGTWFSCQEPGQAPPSSAQHGLCI